MLDRAYNLPWHKCPNGDRYKWGQLNNDKWYCYGCEVYAPQVVQDYYLLIGAKCFNNGYAKNGHSLNHAGGGKLIYAGGSDPSSGAYHG